MYRAFFLGNDGEKEWVDRESQGRDGIHKNKPSGNSKTKKKKKNTAPDIKHNLDKVNSRLDTIKDQKLAAS